MVREAGQFETELAVSIPIQDSGMSWFDEGIEPSDSTYRQEKTSSKSKWDVNESLRDESASISR